MVKNIRSTFLVRNNKVLKRKLDVHIKDKSVRTYIVLKVLKEDESMIRFVGTDTSGEVALVTAENQMRASIKFQELLTFLFLE